MRPAPIRRSGPGGTRSTRKRVAFAATAVILGTVVALALGEIVARVALPPPRVQTVALHTENYRIEDGVPLWGRPPAPCRETHPGARVAQFYGPSIIAGWSLAPDEVFTVHMQRSLDARGVPVCVENHAVPGFTWQGEHQLARSAVPAARPAVVYWAAWVNDPNYYTVIGDWAYNLGPVPRTGPPNPLGLPSGMNAGLFDRSALVRQVDLVLRDNPEPDFGAFAEHQLGRSRELVTAAGAEFVLLVCPMLDRPFAASVAHPSPYERHAIEWAERVGAPHVELARVLVDLDASALNLPDGCNCHFTAAAHRIIAERLAADVEARAR